MPELVNPLASYRDAYSLLEGQAQDRAQRQAGNALAGGDYQGAQSALYGRGMLQEGQAVGAMQQGLQDREAAQQAAEQKAKAEAAKQTLDVLGNATKAALQIPPDQRAEWFRTHAAPQLQGLAGVTPESMQELMDPAHDWSDQALNSYLTMIGQEAEKLQMFNLGDGRGIVAFDGRGQQVEGAGYTPPPDPMRGASPGYRWNGDHTAQEYIPGGPADPRVVGVRAQAGWRPRAPSRGRGGSGGAPGGGPQSMTDEQLAAAIKAAGG